MRSIDQLQNLRLVAFEQGRHSQRENLLMQTHYIAMPASLSQHSHNEKKELNKIYVDLGQARQTQSQWKVVSQSWTIYIPVDFLLLYTSVLLGTIIAWAHQAVRFAHPSAIDNAVGTRPPARVFNIYSPLGTARMTAHLCPVQAMGNVELLQLWLSCTEPTRLCECKLVTECSPEYSRPRMTNRALLTAHWEKAHRTGQRTLRFPKLVTTPAPPHWARFPQAFVIRCAPTQPYAAIRPLWSLLEQKAMRPADSQHKNIPPCLGYTGHLTLWLSWSNRKLTTRINIPSI